MTRPAKMSLDSRISAEMTLRQRTEAVRDIVCDVWNEKYLAGETPAIAMTTLGYPIHSIGDVTLYASLADLPPASCEFYGPDSCANPHMEPGIAWFFVDSNWNLVEGFETPHRQGRCRKASFEDFTLEYGRYFEGMEPRRLDLRI